MALDLEEAQDSNQIARALDFEVIPDEAGSASPWVQISETDPSGETTFQIPRRSPRPRRHGLPNVLQLGRRLWLLEPSHGS